MPRMSNTTTQTVPFCSIYARPADVDMIPHMLAVACNVPVAAIEIVPSPHAKLAQPDEMGRALYFVCLPESHLPAQPIIRTFCRGYEAAIKCQWARDRLNAVTLTRA
jgi:hypothetical protein